jgi:hypothetical protein
MIHELYRLLGQDPTQLVTRLKRLMTNWPGHAVDAAALAAAE